MIRSVYGLLLGLLLLSFPALGAAQPSLPRFPLGTALHAQWEPDPQEALHEVSRYELRINAGAWVQGVGGPIPSPSYQAPLDLAGLARGTHTVSVRACNAEGCSLPASVQFELHLPLPNAPRAPQVIPGPQAVLTIPQAEQRAQAYALWRIDRHLTPAELRWLTARWPTGQRLDKLSLLHFLDAAPW